MKKLALLIIGLAMELTFAPIANAYPGGGTLFVQSPGPYMTPKPEAPGSSCDPNYSGACVPVASDVDCAGGSGNGPAYVSGPVKVTGKDVYGLDRDGNGVGCE